VPRFLWRFCISHGVLSDLSERGKISIDSRFRNHDQLRQLRAFFASTLTNRDRKGTAAPSLRSGGCMRQCACNRTYAIPQRLQNQSASGRSTVPPLRHLSSSISPRRGMPCGRQKAATSQAILMLTCPGVGQVRCCAAACSITHP